MGYSVDYLDEFNILSGFAFLEAYETMADCSDGTVANVLVMKFVNKNMVAIELTFIDGEPSFGEPYAVDDEFKPLIKKDGAE